MKIFLMNIFVPHMIKQYNIANCLWRFKEIKNGDGDVLGSLYSCFKRTYQVSVVGRKEEAQTFELTQKKNSILLLI